MDNSARQIRQRIVGIILSAFSGVVVTALLIVFIVTGISVSNSFSTPPFNQLPIFARLEGYYAGRGNWDGVQTVFAARKITLLDAQRRIVTSAWSNHPVGEVYEPTPEDILSSLKVNGEIVGFLVFNPQTAPSQLGAIQTILLPVGLISVFLALLAAVLITVLSFRIVTPLAEVIAASRAVTAGKLDARVRVRGPQDLLALTESFNQMADTLERNDLERRDLLADIAHELRTPISAIRGRLEGMLDGVYPADEHHISLALKSNYLLERLVEDLRLLTLVESRQLTFDLKTTDLSTLATHTVELFSAEANEKGITLELVPAPGPFPTIVDPQRTEQVIGNLVGNALRYVPQGGQVRLALEKTETSVSLSVSDNGPGIPTEDLPYIFNRFWRKDKSRARHSGGSGLGLAIARQFVEAQGGSIRAENLPEGGLKVTIQLRT